MTKKLTLDKQIAFVREVLAQEDQWLDDIEKGDIPQWGKELSERTMYAAILETLVRVKAEERLLFGVGTHSTYLNCWPAINGNWDRLIERMNAVIADREKNGPWWGGVSDETGKWVAIRWLIGLLPHRLG